MTVVDNETLEHWRDKPGHKSEEEFVQVLSKKLGVAEVSNDFEKRNRKYKDLVYCRTSGEDDWSGEGDLIMYHPRKDTYFHIDLTTSGDPEVISDKKYACLEKTRKAKEKGKNVVYDVLVIPKYVIDQAYRNCEKDILDIRDRLDELLNG